MLLKLSFPSRRRNTHLFQATFIVELLVRWNNDYVTGLNIVRRIFNEPSSFALDYVENKVAFLMQEFFAMTNFCLLINNGCLCTLLFAIVNTHLNAVLLNEDCILFSINHRYQQRVSIATVKPCYGQNSLLKVKNNDPI